jgi:hypothetical protein
VPDGWEELPAFRIEPGESLTIAERSRGKVATDNDLQLSRQLWLDFNRFQRSGWWHDAQRVAP